MARGVKKSIQEKIAQKEELIDALSTRIKKERDELNELLEMQKMEELNELRVVVEKSGMEISEIIQMAHMQVAQYGKMHYGNDNKKNLRKSKNTIANKP